MGREANEEVKREAEGRKQKAGEQRCGGAGE